MISSPRWSVAPGFKVGDSLVDVLERLGIRKSALRDERKFEGDTDRISFEVKNGRIQQIRFDCYTG